MRKRTFWSIFIPSVCTLIIAVLLITGIIYNDSRDDIISEIGYQADYLSKTLNEIENLGEDPVEFFARISDSNEHRITLISSDGNVLYDNIVFPEKMEDHADRPEIKDALANGVGESTRASDTLNSETYYYAVRLESGNVLRIAASLTSGFGVFAHSALAVIPIAAVLAAVALVIAAILSRSLSKPLRNLNFDNPMSNRTYEELTPMLKSIETKNAQIADRMEELTRHRSEFDHITANMSEGIVVFSSEGNILSANASAKKILCIENGEHYTELVESDDVISVLKNAFCGNRTVENISRAGKTFRLTATPVTNPYGEYSVVLLLLDVTSSEQAEKLRREFSANVSHELKTPLTAILGYAEIISNGLAKSEDIPEFSNRIHTEANRLLALIEDIIKLSRLDEKNLRSQFETLDLFEVCHSVCKSLSDKAKNLEIDLSFDGIPLRISGFKPIIHEIVFNLTDNALTYNRKGGSVKIRLFGNSSHPVISVSDTGIGIPESEQSRVFERFYRVDKSHSKETGGTGLGLSIVKHGAMLHGAEISLESELGKGTTITVMF